MVVVGAYSGARLLNKLPDYSHPYSFFFIMADKLETFDDLFEMQPKDLYSAENQLVKALPLMAANAKDGCLRAGLTKHLHETEILRSRSVMCDSSTRLCLAKNSGPTGSDCASKAVALAPFSQNSATERWSSGSGQAHDEQSKPSFWLSLSSACVPRTGQYTKCTKSPGNIELFPCPTLAETLH